MANPVRASDRVEALSCVVRVFLLPSLSAAAAVLLWSRLTQFDFVRSGTTHVRAVVQGGKRRAWPRWGNADGLDGMLWLVSAPLILCSMAPT